jgi:NADPH-dependent glutamate synthase beta subunit-like oxidoreductase
VTLTSVFGVDKMQANKHEIEQAGRRHRHPRRLGAGRRGAGADGRATALRVAQCEAKIVGRKLEIKMIEGTEQDIPADLIVSAIGQAVDFTGLEEFNSGKGAVAADKNYQVQGKPGVFAGGDVIRPHLLTTAIGHGGSPPTASTASCAGEEPGQAPQDRRAQLRPDAQDGREGRQARRDQGAAARHRCLQGTPCTTSTTAPTATSSARGAVPRPLRLHAAQQRTRHHLNKEQALGNFEERLDAAVRGSRRWPRPSAA